MAKLAIPYIVREVCSLVRYVLQWDVGIPMNIEVKGSLSQGREVTVHKFTVHWPMGYRASGRVETWVDWNFGRQVRLSSLTFKAGHHAERVILSRKNLRTLQEAAAARSYGIVDPDLAAEAEKLLGCG